MSYKTNKVIFFISLGLMSLIISWGIWQYYHNPEYVSKRLITQCEANLDIPDVLGHLSPQRVCKIENNSLKILGSEEEMSSEVHPGDTVIISVNLKKILNGQLYDVYTGQTLANPQDNIGAFCFIVYPVLMEKNMVKQNQTDLNDFYTDYSWSIYPNTILNPVSKGDNFICTKPYPLNSYKNISALITIPSAVNLNLGYGETKSYGLKIVMIPDQFKNLQLKDTDVSDNYSDFDPVYLFIKFITM